MHNLYVEAEFKIGNDARSVSYPAGYKVTLSEPMMKAAIDLTELPQHVSILVALQQAGLLEWVYTKAYDGLWEYLSKLFRAMPQGSEEAKASLKVKDNDGTPRIVINNIAPSTLDRAKIVLQEEIATDNKGCQSTKRTIEVDLQTRG